MSSSSAHLRAAPGDGTNDDGGVGPLKRKRESAGMNPHTMQSFHTINDTMALVSPVGEEQTQASDVSHGSGLNIFSAIPKAVFFIIGNEFCERFTFYGIKTVLLLYLVQYLAFDRDNATAAIHTFNMFAYFFPLFGGVLSDSFLGKFRTILYLSLVYCFGSLVMAVTAIPGVTEGSDGLPHSWGAVLGLALLAVGTGGIKPCVSSFGGDQFDERDTRGIGAFFSMFYFAINCGSVASMIFTPVLRAEVRCFGRDDCFPLAFGVPAILMLVATSIFLFGRRYYHLVPPTGTNVVSEVLLLVKHALVNRAQELVASGRHNRSVAAKSHWLDYALHTPNVNPKMVNDSKILMGILVLFLPITIFWSMFDQQGSRWTLQALQLDPRFSVFGWTFSIKADQMQVCNAVLILAMIPLFQKYIYPFVEGRLRLNFTPLRRIAVGMIIASLAYVWAGMLQMYIGQGPKHDAATGDGCTEDGCLSILWQVPQYILITSAEILVSITGLEFAYSQAPKAMKAVTQSAWLLCIAVGNLLVVIVAEGRLFDSEANEFFFFSGLILVSLVAFGWIGKDYVYREDVDYDRIDADDGDDEGEAVRRPGVEYHLMDGEGVAGDEEVGTTGLVGGR